MRELQDDVERRENDLRELAAEKERHHQELALKEANKREYEEYFKLATEAHKQKDATIESVLAEKKKMAAQLEEK